MRGGPVILVGGLGGGGDVGLAALLASSLIGSLDGVVFASFSDCDQRAYRGRRVAGSLFVPTVYGERDFEWALKEAFPRSTVYKVCVHGKREEVDRALDWIADKYRPRCALYADLGGDGLVTGYEANLGSYVTDTLGRAALAAASRRHGWRSLLAVGALYLEGGRRRLLKLEEQVADLLYYERLGLLLGVFEPPRNSGDVLKKLLRPAPGREMVSVMLPLYLASLEGRDSLYIKRGYSTGLHRVDWWTRYVFLVDALGSCEASPLCRAADGGWIEALRHWRRPAPSQDYAKAEKEARRGPEKLLRRIIRRYADDKLLEKNCPQQ